MEQEDIKEEVALHFRRFSEEKQEQVRQLVAYATLMGLTGKDLVSIGGKLDRIKEKQEREANVRIAEGYLINTIPVGKTKAEQNNNEWHKWKYKDANGQTWLFETRSRYSLNIRSMATGKNKNFYPEIYISTGLHGKASKYNALLNIHYGKILLNF